jgi:hypothetical protein
MDLVAGATGPGKVARGGRTGVWACCCRRQRRQRNAREVQRHSDLAALFKLRCVARLTTMRAFHRRVAVASPAVCRRVCLQSFHSSATANNEEVKPVKTKKSVKTTKNFADLPSVRILPDGTPAKPLGAWHGGLDTTSVYASPSNGTQYFVHILRTCNLLTLIRS